MIKCGRCNRVSGKLYPIVVVTRGAYAYSWAHRNCQAQWKRIADVAPDPTRAVTIGKLKPRVSRHPNKTQTPDSAVFHARGFVRAGRNYQNWLYNGDD